MYSIECDPQRSLIRVALIGFMTVEETSSYLRERADVARRNGWTGDDYLLLVDITEFSIQTQEVVDLFRRFSESGLARPKRMVFLAQKPVPRMQARRVFGGVKSIGLAATLEEAEGYLFGDGGD